MIDIDIVMNSYGIPRTSPAAYAFKVLFRRLCEIEKELLKDQHCKDSFNLQRMRESIHLIFDLIRKNHEKT